MKNQAAWQPTKFEWHRGRWRGARDAVELGIGSRLMGDLVAARYVAHQAANRSRRDSPELLEAEHRCVETASQRKWRLPLYEAMVRGPSAVGDPALYAAMQEAFGAYLVERDGLHEFLRFAAGARRDPNHSAEIIYGAPRRRAASGSTRLPTAPGSCRR